MARVLRLIACWLYFCDHNGWVLIDEDTCKELEAHFQAHKGAAKGVNWFDHFSFGLNAAKTPLDEEYSGETGPRLPTLTRRAGMNEYEFDLLAMTQTNTKTNKCRPIRRVCCGHDVNWQWSNSEGEAWNFYPAHIAAYLEYRVNVATRGVVQDALKYRAEGIRCPVTVNVKMASGDQAVVVDVFSMTQKSAGGVIRPVRRVDIRSGVNKPVDLLPTSGVSVVGASKKRERGADRPTNFAEEPPKAEPIKAEPDVVVKAEPSSDAIGGGVAAPAAPPAAATADVLKAWGGELPSVKAEPPAELPPTPPAPPVKPDPDLTETEPDDDAAPPPEGDAPPKRRAKKEASEDAVPPPPSAGGKRRAPAGTAKADATGDAHLIFPSISTAVFMFDLEKAAAIATAEIAAFFGRYPASTHPSLRLTLLDFDPDGATETETIAAFKKHWASTPGGGDPRLQFRVGDVSTLSGRGERARFIANAGNTSFTGGKMTGGWNRALHVAAGEKELQADHRARFPKGGSVGPAFEVPVRSTSPLFGEGTRYVITVIGPNMNPHRPHCLKGDYTKGTAQLRQVYQSLLNTFGKLAFP